MSASEAVTAFPETRPLDRAAIGTEALAQGLHLVRASALNMVRLQLALERRDRPVALQTVDELMLLDRQLGDLVGDLAAGGEPAGSRALENQRRLLLTEKFALAAAASGPRMREGPIPWIEQAAPPAPTAGPIRNDETGGGQSEPDWQADPGERHRISARLAVALAFLAVLAAAAAFLFLTETGRALIAAPATVEGAQP